MMKNSLLIDPSFAEFSEMEKAAASVNGLYDTHDGREFVHDKSMWSDEYVAKLMTRVVLNFSHERINHLKEVVKYREKRILINKTNKFTERRLK